MIAAWRAGIAFEWLPWSGKVTTDQSRFFYAARLPKYHFCQQAEPVYPRLPVDIDSSFWHNRPIHHK